MTLSNSSGSTLRPSKVRRIVLDEHKEIRKQMTEIERLAVAKDLVGLSHAVLVFQKTFKAHLLHEEAILWPILEAVDSWGPVRIEKMSKEHQEQRQMIENLSNLKKAGSVNDMIKVIRDLMVILTADMTAEESEFLNPEIMRDDVVSVGHFGG